MAGQEAAWVRAGRFLFSLGKVEIREEDSPTGRRRIHVPEGAYNFFVTLCREAGQTLPPSKIFPTARPSRQSENCYKAVTALGDALGHAYVEEYIDTQKGEGYALKGSIEFLDDRRNVVGKWVPPLVIEIKSAGEEPQNQVPPSPDESSAETLPLDRCDIEARPNESRTRKPRSGWTRVASSALILILIGSFCSAPTLWVLPDVSSSHEAAEKKDIPFSGVVWELPPQAATIYLANIDGPETNRYRVTDVLLSELNRLKKDHRDIQIISLERAISPQDNISGLLQGLRQRQAALLIWGWYSLTSKSVYLDLRFEFTLPWTAELGTSEQTTQVRPLIEMETFQVPFDLAKDVRDRILLTEGLLYLARGEFSNSEQVLREAVSRSATRANQNAISLLIAKTQLLQHHEVAALQTLQGMASSGKLTAEEKLALLTMRAQIYTVMANFDAAHSDIGAAIAEGQQYQKDRGCSSQELVCRLYALALLQHGKMLFRQGNLSAARADFKTSEAIANNPESYRAEAAVDGDMRLYDDGIAAMDKVIALSPGRASAYSDRGFLKLRRGRKQEALDDINRAVELDPDEPTFRANRGYIEQSLRMESVAAADFDFAARAMRADQKLAGSLAGLCSVMIKRSQYCPN